MDEKFCTTTAAFIATFSLPLKGTNIFSHTSQNKRLTMMAEFMISFFNIVQK